jgi:hypothetical protein
MLLIASSIIESMKNSLFSGEYTTKKELEICLFLLFYLGSAHSSPSMGRRPVSPSAVVVNATSDDSKPSPPKTSIFSSHQQALSSSSQGPKASGSRMSAHVVEPQLLRKGSGRDDPSVVRSKPPGTQSMAHEVESPQVSRKSSLPEVPRTVLQRSSKNQFASDEPRNVSQTVTDSPPQMSRQASVQDEPGVFARQLSLNESAL